MTSLDWAIITLYFVFASGVGVAMSRRAGSSITEFFVGGRSLLWWLAGTSMVATTFAVDTPLVVTFLTHPEDDEVLRAFYLRVRPGGRGLEADCQDGGSAR